MSTRLLSIAVLCMGICGTNHPTAAADGAAERAKNHLTFDVVLEDVDLSAKTITARSYIHVVPPSGSTGGVAYSGNPPPGAKPTRFERLPFMPKAGMRDKGLKSGMRVTIRMDVVKGALVVVGIERRLDPEKVGIDFLDAPAPKASK